MKFRKVAKTNAATSTTWTKSSSNGTVGCAINGMRVKSHNFKRLPLDKLKKKEAPPTQEDESETCEATSTTSNESGVVSEDTQQQTTQEKVEEMEQQEDFNEPTPPEPIEYKMNASLVAPPKTLVKYFYDKAMQKKSDKSEQEYWNDQRELVPAGLLSMEQVLLPLVACLENENLKQMQRKIQRDSPDQVYIVKAARAAVSNCLGTATEAARKSRLERRVLEEQRERQWEHERQSTREKNRVARAQEVEQRRAEEAKQKEANNLKQMRESQRKFLPNQELWREVAYLMTESSKLEREGRLWKDAEALLDAREKEIEAREAAQAQEDATMTDDDAMKENRSADQTTPMDELQKSTEDIIGSSNEIQTALKLVTDLMLDSAKLRKDLYRRYRQDHQFEGYRGVHDPKGLIRILSQDDP